MAKPRATGADARLIGITEATYGTAPADGYVLLPFKSIDLDKEVPLGDDPLLGQGRAAQGAYYDRQSVTGAIEIPLDIQSSGFWLHGLMGDPVTTSVKAYGSFNLERHHLDVRLRLAWRQRDANRRQPGSSDLDRAGGRSQCLGRRRDRQGHLHRERDDAGDGVRYRRDHRQRLDAGRLGERERDPLGGNADRRRLPAPVHRRRRRAVEGA